MINETPQQYDVSGNITGDKIAMGIHADAMAHIMGVLTDLYSDPMLAILREYSTNALDAHVEAGQTRPIEVTTPSSLSPFFTVQDFGIGMSHDDIRSIYSQYGASTKRDTNSQVGMLGLGCKSALTYASQFTLVGVKDGVRVTVVIGRDEDGAGSMTVIDTATTDDPNGVTIQVPAKIADAYMFQNKARDFFRFWEPGTVLVDGKQPAPVEGLKITDDLTVIEGGQSYVIMGNVAYPANIEHGLSWRTSLVARVPIGAVNFTPSREALHYTPKTEATIKRVSAEFKTAKREAVERLVGESDTHHAALLLATQWANKLGVQRNSLRYKGETLPDSYSPPKGQAILTTRDGKLSGHTTMVHLNAEVFDRTMVIENYDAVSFTAGQKKKLLIKASEVRQDGGSVLSFRNFLLLHGKLDPAWAKWFPKDAVVDWAPIKALKLPKAVKVNNQYRLAGSFDLRRGGKTEYEVPAQEIGKIATTDLFYLHGNPREGSHYDSFLSDLNANATLVCLPGNRLDKFQRTFPHAKNVKEAIREGYQKWLKKVPAEQKLAWSTQRNLRNTEALRALDLSRVPDPAFAKVVKVLKTDTTKFEKRLGDWRKLGMRSYSDVEVTPLTCPLENYPLFDYPVGTGYYAPKGEKRARQIEHNYLYLAAAYAADQAAKTAQA